MMMIITGVETMTGKGIFGFGASASYFSVEIIACDLLVLYENSQFYNQNIRHVLFSVNCFLLILFISNIYLKLYAVV